MIKHSFVEDIPRPIIIEQCKNKTIVIGEKTVLYLLSLKHSVA